MATSLSNVNWARYVADFLDSRTFADGKAAAKAIAAQSLADHGKGDTIPLEMQTIVEYNRRATDEDRRRRAEWLEEARAGFAALSQDERDEFADAVALGMV